MKKKYKFLIAIICVVMCLLFWFIQRNIIVGTIYGAEMEKIIIDNVTYVRGDTPYNGTDKSFHIGKGAWQDGTRVLDLYRIKGDEEFNYLYARHGWEGQMYVRENLKNREQQ